jgi:hypothetical protein
MGLWQDVLDTFSASPCTQEPPVSADPETVRVNRRGLLLGAAGMLGSVNMLAAACSNAATRTPYQWRKGAMDGGGFCNAMATDPLQPGHAAAAGDVWGEFATKTAGDLWYPTMTGATSIGAIYGRAVAYSKQTPGLRYFGIGVLKTLAATQGYLGAVGPRSLTLERRNGNIGFSSYLPVGNAHDVPRAVGNLIAVDFDAHAGREYLYMLTRQGLVRSRDGGHTLHLLGLPAVAPHAAWAALCVCPDGSLLAASFRTSQSAGSQVWRITNPRGTATVTAVAAAPAVVEDIAVVDGVVYAACGPFGLYRVNPSGAWTQLAPAAFHGCHLASVTGHSGVLWVGNGIGMHDHRYIAKSTDAGRTFNWTTTPTHVSEAVLGTSRAWWLGSSWPGLDGHGYSVSQLAVDPADANTCYSAGRSGIVATRDGGATWRPAMNGLDGSEIHQVQAGPGPGEAWATDTDWNGIHTMDHWRTCVRVPDAGDIPRLHAPSLVRERNGRRYEVVLSNPRKMLVDGADVASDFFRAACINPSDLAVSRDNRVYIGLYGGGVLVGHR